MTNSRSSRTIIYTRSSDHVLPLWPFSWGYSRCEYFIKNITIDYSTFDMGARATNWWEQTSVRDISNVILLTRTCLRGAYYRDDFRLNQLGSRDWLSFDLWLRQNKNGSPILKKNYDWVQVSTILWFPADLTQRNERNEDGTRPIFCGSIELRGGDFFGLTRPIKSGCNRKCDH